MYMPQTMSSLTHTGDGVNAQSFPYLEEEEVKEVIKKLSLGGRSVFRRLWRENRVCIVILCVCVCVCVCVCDCTVCVSVSTCTVCACL